MLCYSWLQLCVPLAVILYFSLAHACLWLVGRMTLPARAFLIMFAAAFVVYAWNVARLKGWRGGATQAV